VRTNIDLDDALVEEAFRHAGTMTKRDLVHLALTEFVERRRRIDPRDVRGTVSFDPDYDYKALRGSTGDR